MKFCALRKTSLIDYPNRIASVLFTPGCNLRCPYCHNWRIVSDPRPPFLQEEYALKILERRRRYIDAVVVTGGEPTMHKELPRFIGKLRAKGFSVKLDTNGFYPEILEQCLSHVDYVALDVKTSLEKYHRLGAGDTSGFMRAIEMLKEGETEYEFRTTAVPGFVDHGDIGKMCELIKGARLYVLQQFIAGDTFDRSLTALKPYSFATIQEYAKSIDNFVDSLVLRT